MLSERMWAKLVNLDALHWYCDGPEPIVAAYRYERQVRQHKSIAQHVGFFFLLLNYLTYYIHPHLCRNGRQQKKGLHQAASCCKRRA